MGRAGKLNVNIDNAKLVDGEKVALRAVKEVKGGSHVPQGSPKSGHVGSAENRP
jgi:hypothetical protein